MLGNHHKQQQQQNLLLLEGVNSTTILNSAIAGYAAGSFGVIFGYPLDSIKVWIQTNSTGKNKHLVGCSTTSSSTSTSCSNNVGTTRTGTTSVLTRPISTSIGTTASMSTLTATTNTTATNNNKKTVPILIKNNNNNIINNNYSFRNVTKTLRALYSGASGPLMTVGIVQAINFTIYDTVRRVLHRLDKPNSTSSSDDYLKNDSLTNCAVAGLIAGSGVAIISSPLMMVKNRQQVTGSGLRDAIRSALMCSSSGGGGSSGGGRLSAKRCFRGFFPHYIAEAPGRAIYYFVYEGCKRQIAKSRCNNNNGGCDNTTTTITLKDRMVSAALSGILCWAFIFPMDTLRSRLYNQDGPKILSTTEMAKQIYKEGVFYRGFWLTVMRAGPVAAAVLPVYDICLEKLSSSPS